ncbi:hypothetical protein E3N88_30091 [Mikania micrantha]|uniref:Uncharacterized protein n=1 Tax=Mikania micrantha TaxID=192012 RepID=A0A5N6ML85_9ASTR|nr:hypothetical protein E3N88_30091 [Mikania micrantha]
MLFSFKGFWKFIHVFSTRSTSSPQAPLPRPPPPPRPPLLPPPFEPPPAPLPAPILPPLPYFFNNSKDKWMRSGDWKVGFQTLRIKILQLFLPLCSQDLKQFIQLDSDEIPNSLRQLSKITKSIESIASVTRALAVGILRGYKVGARESDPHDSFSDHALDKLLSPAGSLRLAYASSFSLPECSQSMHE